MAAATEKSGVAAPPAKKGKLGMLLTLGIGVLLGSAGTFGVTRLVYAEKPVASPVETPPSNEQKPEPATARRIIALKPLIVNIKDTRMTRHLRVVIGLDVNNEKAVEELSRLDIPVHDFLVERLGLSKLEELDNLTDRNKLKRELLSGINELLEGGAVTKLYFADFVVQ